MNSCIRCKNCTFATTQAHYELNVGELFCTFRGNHYSTTGPVNYEYRCSSFIDDATGKTFLEMQGHPKGKK